MDSGGLLRRVRCCGLLLALGLVAQALSGGHSRAQEARRLPDPTPFPTPASDLTMMIESEGLVPGSTAEAKVRTLKAIPLAQGRLVLRFEPAVFIDNPVLRFGETVPADSFSLTTLAPGAYAIDFESPGSPLNTRAGVLLSLTGIVQQDLPIGGSVSVNLEASARTVGEDLAVDARGGTLLLVAEEEMVVLHVSDASSLTAGGTVDVRIASYNPKPISQGQVDLAYDRRVFVGVSSVTVHGAEPDVSFTTDLSEPGIVRISFASPRASINRLEGPMITVRMTVAPGLPPGLETSIEIPLQDVYLLDHALRPIAISSTSGRFRIGDSISDGTQSTAPRPPERRR